MQTARANQIEPYAYLRRMLEELPTAQTVGQIEALLPWASHPTHSEDGEDRSLTASLRPLSGHREWAELHRGPSDI